MYGKSERVSAPKLLEEQVLDHDGEAERGQQRCEHARAQAALEHRPLQQPAERSHRREDEDEREPRRDPVVGGEDPHGKPAEHCEVAVGEVDDPHHAEHQGEAAREQGVVAAEQYALDDLVDPDHACSPVPRPRLRPKYASMTCSRVTSSAGPLRTIRPSSMQQTRSATDSARAEILLDEDERGATLDQRAQRRVDRLDRDGSEPERHLVEEQQPRVGHQRPADRGRLLLAAGEIARARLPMGLQEREGVEDTIDSPRPGPSPVAPATRRFSSTVRPRNSRRPSGTSAIPMRTRLCAREA